MYWDVYTVFSVISGILLLGLGVLGPNLSTGERLWMIVPGLAIGAYGLYVAMQESGSYSFGVGIFIIPVIALGYAISKVLAARRASTPPGEQA